MTNDQVVEMCETILIYPDDNCQKVTIIQRGSYIITSVMFKF